MNQTKFARQIDITQQYVSKIINGRRRPCWEKAKKIASITDTSPELWLEGDATARKAAFRRWIVKQKAMADD
jgi:plasmid maintenance system antidote protein VapI